MYGSLTKNEVYCSNEGHYTKLGDEPKQGERHDILDCMKRFGANPHVPPVVLASEDGHFSNYCNVNSAYEKYHQSIRAESMRIDREMPKVYIRIGNTASGKTHWLDDTFGLAGWARMPHPTSSWWITPTVPYSGTVLIDDVGPAKVPH